MKRKYKVLGGTHRDENGVIYSKGETVNTIYNLCKAFPGKFEDLGPVTGPGPFAKTSEAKEPAPEPDEETQWEGNDGEDAEEEDTVSWTPPAKKTAAKKKTATKRTSKKRSRKQK